MPALGVKPLLSLPGVRRAVEVAAGRLPPMTLLEKEYMSDCMLNGWFLTFLRFGEESMAVDGDAAAEA